MSEWISVKERLPEDFEQVIVLCEFKKSLHISSIQFQTITTAKHQLIDIRTWEGLINPQVTHWMYLSKPPETSTGDQE